MSNASVHAEELVFEKPELRILVRRGRVDDGVLLAGVKNLDLASVRRWTDEQYVRRIGGLVGPDLEPSIRVGHLLGPVRGITWYLPPLILISPYRSGILLPALSTR